MVKMSLDPVQVMTSQVKELKVVPSANGDSRGSWEEKEEFDQDHLGLTTKPKPVSLSYSSEMSLCLFIGVSACYRLGFLTGTIYAYCTRNVFFSPRSSCLAHFSSALLLLS